MKNQEVAGIFAQMADILAIQGENYHRIMAYRRAAENIATLGRPIEEVWQAGELETIPGIGKTLAAKIDELMRTGRLGAYEKLKAQVPAGVVEMLQIPDVGPKRAALFWKELGITTIEALEQAAREGRLRTLPGMGAKSEEKVLAGIEALRRRTGRTPLGVAWPLAQAMLDALRQVPGVVQAAPAGSLRRMRETVGDLDLLVAAKDPEPVMACFRALPQVAKVLLSGPTKTSIRTHEGLQVDLRVLEPARWGTALQYFTGSQAHNIHLRALALDRGLSLSEYALKREDGSEILCATEEEVYAALGLPLIPPELREDRGEIEAALKGRLPDLIELKDLKGDLHFHTTWSDGHHSLLEMAQAARACGLKYALVTDHSHSLGVARGLTVERLREQRAEIEEVNRKMGGTFRLLAGIEVEVRADGTLDLPDEALAELDLVVAAVHSGLRQGREQVTARMLAAIRNPHVDIIAHPTGRLLGEREGADLDMEAVFRAAAETGTALEINAHPKRLDLRDVHVRRAIELGVKLAINSDAHGVNGFGMLPFGVATARRGWATAEDVINTWSVKKVLVWATGRR
ncbi:MAG TPA: DNA polymerase/3'-5' exonuclease PolX [Thermoflexia bacterium]|nr:DNA polymerase/3'-5' exonuclease PolX [Thermoflexia bacterium]